MAHGAGKTRAERAARARHERERRHAIAQEVAHDHDGVATWTMLVGAGLTRGQIRTELERGTWRSLGRHTIAVNNNPVAAVSAGAASGASLWWRALWECGGQSVLDGPTALLVAGLVGWSEPVIHVTVPNRAKVRPIQGVRIHRLRDRGMAITIGLRRIKPPVAVTVPPSGPVRTGRPPRSWP